MPGNLETSNSLCPHKLYSPDFVANLAGVHKQTIYLAIKGSRDLPLPVVTRLGRTIRFRGAHIVSWLDQIAGVTPAKSSAENEKVISQSSKRRGRPPLQPKVLAEEAA